MRKVIHKWFWAWDFDKEEKWLNEMAARGLVLTAVGWCRFEFEDCTPGEYKICLQFLENKFSEIENTKYINFLEETGAEYVGTCFHWAYFRKKTTENFRLFSDNVSRIKNLTKIIRFIALIGGLNLYIGCYNLFMCFFWNNHFNIIGIINCLIAVICATGIIRLCKKRNILKAEQQIFE